VLPAGSRLRAAERHGRAGRQVGLLCFCREAFRPIRLVSRPRPMMRRRLPAAEFNMALYVSGQNGVSEGDGCIGAMALERQAVRAQAVRCLRGAARLGGRAGHRLKEEGTGKKQYEGAMSCSFPVQCGKVCASMGKSCMLPALLSRQVAGRRAVVKGVGYVCAWQQAGGCVAKVAGRRCGVWWCVVRVVVVGVECVAKETGVCVCVKIRR